MACANSTNLNSSDLDDAGAFGVKIVSNEVIMQSAEVALALFEQAPVAMLLIDEAGNIRALNAAAELLFGYEKSELVGCCMEVLVPEVLRLKHERLREDFFRSPSSRPMGQGRRLSARRKDGREIPISVGLSPVTIGANPVLVIASFTDNSAQERAERAELLVRELTHRAKNVFAVVSAMSHQIGAVSTDVASFQTDFDERLSSFAASHELLVRENWHSVPIADLVRSQLAFVSGRHAAQVAIEGPALRLSASPAEYLGLALHELATNAMKYGALSVPSGKVFAVWKIDKAKGRLLFDWQELNRPPVAEPHRKGFGLVILKTVVPAVFGGTAELRYRPHGMSWHLDAPLNQLLAEESKTLPGIGVGARPI
jgi:PAS domain S-box-containing protein